MFVFLYFVNVSFYLQSTAWRTRNGYYYVFQAPEHYIEFCKVTTFLGAVVRGNARKKAKLTFTALGAIQAE